MKLRVGYGTLALCGILLLSCGTAEKEIALRSQSERTDVYKEVQEGKQIPGEFVELTIASSIKTHSVGHYPLESRGSFHGIPGYPFLINIDGQATTWRVNGQKESAPTHDASGKRSSEGGEGMRYNLRKKVLLRAGSHKMFFGLPEEKLLLHFELVLKAGESYVLEFRPVYRSHIRRYPHFAHGVRSCEVFLDGNAIKLQK